MSSHSDTGRGLASEKAQTAGAAARLAHWPEFVTGLLALLYVAGVAVGWMASAADGYYGITAVGTVADESSRLAIVGVEPGSPADRAGLRAGDVIIAVDGERRAAGSRARWAGTSASPSFQTRPLSISPGDAPLFRRTTGLRHPGDRSTLRVQRADAAGVDSSVKTEDVAIVLDSQLSVRGVVAALIIWHIVALLMLVVGVVVLLRRPSDLAARLLLAMAGCFAMALVLLSWDNRPLSTWLALAAQLATAALLVLGSASLLHLCLSFPSSHRLLLRLESLRANRFGPIGRATAALYFLPLALATGIYLGPASIWPWSYLVSIALIASAVAVLGWRILHPPTAVARAQLKWIGGPLFLGVAALALGPGVSAVTGSRSELVTPTATVAVWALFPVGVAVAILRYRLFDVDLVLRAAMLYPLLAALLAAAYIAAAQALGRLAVSLMEPSALDNLTVSVLAALLVAAGAQPGYRRLQAALDRVLYRERLSRQLLLEEAMALHALSVEDLATFLTSHVVDRLDLLKAWLVLPKGVTASDGYVPSALLTSVEPLLARVRDGERPIPLFELGDVATGGVDGPNVDDPAVALWGQAGARLMLPLRAVQVPPNASGAGLLGLWLIGTKRSGSLLDSEDAKALGQIARQAAVILDRHRLHGEEAAHMERNARFRRYFSPQIADLIAVEGGELAPHRRELTVLFAEVRGLNPLGGIVEPEELVQHLNEYVDAITAVVFEHGGTLDKFHSDGVLAFFGDPLPQPDHARRAMRAAVAMRYRLKELKQRLGAGVAHVEVGVGLATGWVTVGTIGSTARQEYTVVGDAVTVATRLAATSRADEVLLVEKTRRLLGEDVALLPRGELILEGRGQPVPVFGFSTDLAGKNDTLGGTLRPLEQRGHRDPGEVVGETLSATELLAGTPLFASLPLEELKGLASRLRVHRFKKGALIQQAHDTTSSFFLIRSGTVKVARSLVTGDEAVINILGRGEFFGELALLEGQSSGSTVVALQPTEVLVLSREMFLDCLRSYPAAASAAVGLLSDRIRSLSDQLEEAYALELPQRLARRLLALGSIHGRMTDEGLVIDLSLTQTELAGMVGASRQRVNRILAEWQDRRLLRLGSYGKMTLLSPDAFTDISPEPLVS